MLEVLYTLIFKLNPGKTGHHLFFKMSLINRTLIPILFLQDNVTKEASVPPYTKVKCFLIRTVQCRWDIYARVIL